MAKIRATIRAKLHFYCKKSFKNTEFLIYRAYKQIVLDINTDLYEL